MFVLRTGAQIGLYAESGAHEHSQPPTGAVKFAEAEPRPIKATVVGVSRGREG